MTQIPMFDLGLRDQVPLSENPDYLTRQLITYLGNKRSLAAPLEQAIVDVRNRLGGRKLRTLDLFSGSGFVSRLLKKHSTLIEANDLEVYARSVSECFLSDPSETLLIEAATHVERMNLAVEQGASRTGFVRDLYSPVDDRDIQLGERVFYSNDNARRLDFFAQELQELKPEIKTLLMGPLLAKASVHANTGGVFKGFYKDKATGIGKFGAAAGDALQRILSPIRLELPVTSSNPAEYRVHQQDANELAARMSEVDLVYLDPPYNQHPYGSNYFMLNLLVNYERPEEVSKVSGIPPDWNRSGFNVRKRALPLMENLLASIPARFLLVSFNSEGFIATEDMNSALEAHGLVEEEIVKYNAYRASRNLSGRDLYVNEHIYLLDREG